LKVDFVAELRSTIRSHELWIFLAWQEIRRQYHRTVFGPFWLTIGVIVYALALNLVFGRVFAVGSDLFMPWVTCGLIAW
jgi:ABC-2 type transport system permease protein